VDRTRDHNAPQLRLGEEVGLGADGGEGIARPRRRARGRKPT
jgi:hypothetical protein